MPADMIGPSDPALPPQGAPEQPLVQVGDIVVSAHWVVTPNGPAPLAGSQWTVRDLSFPVQKTPTWAIVLAVVGFFFFLGLLFLLVKETRMEGYIEVTVRSGHLVHVTQIPRASPAGFQAFEQVRYAQQLAWQAGQQG
ncbi:hypothetical protein Cch01nite_39870 [Cellulomonas chitinilytica]|uniref:Uncharacterized protein n=1 Tax=Cellulomonas chitinilytica TaxID=398759 RepID=A0A919P777_9CELL|nr:hypothetical protein [Cellulomonas chitinilytica]GIG23263.1 hypothetical protein Cch01nite_39870 [Cellulomonas chitinilytica]